MSTNNNLSNKKKDNNEVFYLLFILIEFCLLGFFIGHYSAVKTYEIKPEVRQLITKESISPVELLKEFRLSNQLLDTIKINTIVNSLEVKKVESINDKRFEVLGWGMALLFTLIGAVLFINNQNSKSAARDMVIKEFDERFNDFKVQYTGLISEIAETRDKYVKELEEILQ